MKQLTSKWLVLLLIVLLPLLAHAQPDLKKPFQDCGIKGSITIYDLKNNKWIYNNKKDAKRGTLPASTFKILNSLILLEEGAVQDEKEVLKWDGVNRSIPSWNADTDMAHAFANSTVWFYVALAGKIGKESYRKYLPLCKYGNGEIDYGQGADFWNYGNFEVTPIEQIELLRKLYQEKLPFSPRTFEIVKRIMVVEQTPSYTLRAKTGLTNFADTDTGWYVGYVEKQDNVYFFATRLQKKVKTKNENFVTCRKTITQQILQQLNILP